MTKRPALLLLVAATACSQRAPWRIVDVNPASAPASASASAPRAPATPPTAPATSTPDSGTQPGRASKLALSMVAGAPSTEAALDATAVAHLKGMLFPVGGRSDSTRLDDSFDAPRDGGARKHNAIDIMAPRGTPILAVSDGRVLRLSKSSKGGLTVYATDLENQFVYYFAHLDRYNPKLYNGKPLMRGDTLGFVGTTGNSPPNLPHLHFQVMRMPADGNYWLGTPINPYPLLHGASATDK